MVGMNKYNISDSLWVTIGTKDIFETLESNKEMADINSGFYHKVFIGDNGDCFVDGEGYPKKELDYEFPYRIDICPVPFMSASHQGIKMFIRRFETDMSMTPQIPFMILADHNEGLTTDSIPIKVYKRGYRMWVGDLRIAQNRECRVHVAIDGDLGFFQSSIEFSRYTFTGKNYDVEKIEDKGLPATYFNSMMDNYRTPDSYVHPLDKLR